MGITVIGSGTASVIAATLFDAKGDLIVATADDTPARLAVGTNGQILRANSAAATGVEWSDETPPADFIAETLVDAKGDLIVGSAADTAARLGVGANGQVLTVDSTQTLGVKWGDPATGSGGTTSLALAAETVSNTSYTLVAADVYKKKRTTNSATTTVTLPPNASVSIAVGAWVELFQAGTGQLVVAGGSGVTVNSYGGSLACAGRYGSLRAHKVATNEWDLEGMVA